MRFLSKLSKETRNFFETSYPKLRCFRQAGFTPRSLFAAVGAALVLDDFRRVEPVFYTRCLKDRRKRYARLACDYRDFGSEVMTKEAVREKILVSDLDVFCDNNRSIGY